MKSEGKTVFGTSFLVSMPNFVRIRSIMTELWFVRPAHPLNPILTKFGVWGGLPDVFLKFEFQEDWSINVGAVGGSKFAFSQ